MKVNTGKEEQFEIQEIFLKITFLLYFLVRNEK